MKFRATFVFIVFIFVYAAVSARLYVIQVHQKNFFSSSARAGGSAKNPVLNAHIENRGQIFVTDRSGTEKSVAFVNKYPAVFISPKEVSDVWAVSSLISELFGEDAKLLAEKIEKKKQEGNEYLLIEERASNDAVVKIQERKLKGISIENRLDRFYPFREFGSHVIGFVDNARDSQSSDGLYGIEKYFNNKLAGGEDVHLTIDRGIQNHVETLLDDLMRDYGADGGTIIVENPKTGEILAMASKPDFDPNEYGKYEIKNFLNPAVQLIYEPGSVIKPLTLSAGIDTGKVTPETTYVDTGSVTLNGKTVHNFENKVYGKITMREMIQNSINTGAIQAERLVGHKDFYNYLSAYGLDEETGIELPGEIPGTLRNLKSKDVRAIDFATAAYGQGISVTPIRLISAYAALANDGVLMRPYITRDNSPSVVRRVIKSETAKTIRDILASTVVKNRVATISGYNIAGKTGTAFIADPRTGKYSDAMIHTFVGFAPASDPKFVALVKLERPKHGEAAGVTVVSTFKKLAEFLLNYYHIPPDNLEAVSVKK